MPWAGQRARGQDAHGMGGSVFLARDSESGNSYTVEGALGAATFFPAYERFYFTVPLSHCSCSPHGMAVSAGTVSCPKTGFTVPLSQYEAHTAHNRGFLREKLKRPWCGKLR